MRTTVRLDEALIARAKREAVERGVTFTALIEQGLRLAIAKPHRSARRQQVKLPVSKKTGGVLPGVNLDNNAALLDQMEERF
jgi:hypothetical protein